MPTDILIDLKSHDRPLFTAAKALGEAGINIDGLSGPSTVNERLVGHLLVENPTAAIKALEDAGLDVVLSQDVLVLDIADRPGALAELYGKAQVLSVDFAYLNTHAQIVIGAENLDETRKALGQP